MKSTIGVNLKFSQQAKLTYITNKAQTKQIRKAVNRTNNKIKQGYNESRQQILQRLNRGKLSKAEPRLETSEI